jgi:hypothetical protein
MPERRVEGMNIRSQTRISVENERRLIGQRDCQMQGRDFYVFQHFITVKRNEKKISTAICFHLQERETLKKILSFHP